MITALLVSLALSNGPIPAAQAQAPKRVEAAKPAPEAAPAEKPVVPPAKPEAKLPPPAVVQPAPTVPMTPDVQKAVEQMQKFYEETKDFEAKFQQTYKYKSFARKTEASGRVRFLKGGASMRWDYQKPNEKVFVVAGNKVYAYDKEAKQLTIAGIDTERLSASITFLWGQGKLEREFNIQSSDRKDLAGGIALELTPKTPDPRFQKIFFLLDPKTYAVRESIVVDPDGSENRMTFSEVKTNTGFGPEAFKLEPPEGTQVIRMDGAAPAQKP